MRGPPHVIYCTSAALGATDGDLPSLFTRLSSCPDRFLDYVRVGGCARTAVAVISSIFLRGLLDRSWTGSGGDGFREPIAHRAPSWTRRARATSAAMERAAGRRGRRSGRFYSNAAETVLPQPVYVRLPNAMMPTPYSGSHRINDPYPGRPPLCAIAERNWQVWVLLNP